MNESKGMWYVMQVRCGDEEKIRRQCEILIPDSVLNRCFIPTYEERRKFRGTWVTQKRRLFPGYVFLDTVNVPDLFGSLRRVAGLTKLLKTGDEIIPLSDDEVDFLLALGGDEQIAGLSELAVEGSQVVILSGPLKGKEGLIRKIDKHKRKVFLEAEMFGRIQRIELGFEFAMQKTG